MVDIMSVEVIPLVACQLFWSHSCGVAWMLDAQINGSSFALMAPVYFGSRGISLTKLVCKGAALLRSIIFLQMISVFNMKQTLQWQLQHAGKSVLTFRLPKEATFK